MDRRAALLPWVALLLVACTGGSVDEESGATTTASDPAPSPGPLVVTPDRPEGSSPLPDTTVFQVAVGDGGDGADGADVAVLYDDPADPDTSRQLRLALGPDPATWSPVAPTDIESGNAVGRLAVGADGSVTALAVLNGDGDAFGLHVLRVGADGTQTATRVPDARVGLVYATADAVSDDGTTAVVATTDPGTDDPAAIDQLEVLTVDLASATVTARTVADLGTDRSPDVLDVGIAADGAVSVLLGRAPGDGDTDGAELARFAPGLQYTGSVVLDAAARSQTAVFDLAPDGTAVASLQTTLRENRLSTRVLTLAPGDSDVVPVTDLDGVAVDGLVRGPDGWVYLSATSYTTGTVPALLPLDLATGDTADPVELCPDGRPFELARSGSGDTLLAWTACGPSDTRLFVLTPR